IYSCIKIIHNFNVIIIKNNTRKTTMLREDRVKRIQDMIKVIDQTLENLPDLLSMHSGDNVNNSRIDWDNPKPTQKFSSDWINRDGIKGPLSLGDETSALEFALDSSKYLVVQTEFTKNGHIDLVDGDNCYCAGTLEFNSEGFLTGIRLDSGHYCPTVE